MYNCGTHLAGGLKLHKCLFYCFVWGDFGYYVCRASPGSVFDAVKSVRSIMAGCMFLECYMGINVCFTALYGAMFVLCL